MATKTLDIKLSGSVGGEGSTELNTILRDLSTQLSKNNSEISRMVQALSKLDKPQAGDYSTTKERTAKYKQGQERAKASTIKYHMEAEKAQLQKSSAYRKNQLLLAQENTKQKELSIQSSKLLNSRKRLGIKEMDSTRLNINATNRLTKQQTELANTTGTHKTNLKKEQSKQIRLMQKQRNIEMSNLQGIIAGSSGKRKMQLEDQLIDFITGNDRQSGGGSNEQGGFKGGIKGLGKLMFGGGGLLYAGHLFASTLSHSYLQQANMMKSAMSNPIANGYSFAPNMINSMEGYLATQDDYTKLRMMGGAGILGGIAAGVFSKGNPTAIGLGATAGVSLGEAFGITNASSNKLSRTVLGTAQERAISNVQSADVMANTNYYGRQILERSNIFAPKPTPEMQKINGYFDKYYQTKNMSHNPISPDPLLGRLDIRRDLTDPIANSLGAFDKLSNATDRITKYMVKAQIPASQIPEFMKHYNQLRPTEKQFQQLQNLSLTWGVPVQNIMERAQSLRMGGYDKDQAINLASKSFQRSEGNMDYYISHMSGDPLQKYIRNKIYKSATGVDLEKDLRNGAVDTTRRLRNAQRGDGNEFDMVLMSLIGMSGQNMQLNPLESRDTIIAPSMKTQTEKMVDQINDTMYKGVKGTYDADEIAKDMGKTAESLAGFSIEIDKTTKSLESMNDVLNNTKSQSGTYNFGGNY